MSVGNYDSDCKVKNISQNSESHDRLKKKKLRRNFAKMSREELLQVLGEIDNGRNQSQGKYKQVQRSLKLTPNKFYRSLYQHTPLPHFSINMEGEIVRCNQATASLLNIEHEQLLSQNFLQFVDSDNQNTFREFIKKSPENSIWIKLDTEDSDILQVRLEKIDVDLKTDQKEYPFIITHVDQINEQETETHIALMRAIIDRIRDSVMVLDKDLKILHTNQSFHRYFNTDSKQTINQYIYELADGAWNTPILLDLLQQTLPIDKVIENIEFEHTFPKIGQRQILLNLHEVELTDGTAPLIVMSFDDVTEQYKTKKAQREIERRLDLVLRGAPIVLFSQDTEFRYTWIYNALENFEIDNIRGKTDLDLMENKEDAEKFNTFKRDVIATGETQRGIFPLHYQGTPLYYDVTAEPQRSDTGEITGIICTALDVTDYIETQKRTHILQELSTGLAKATTIQQIADIFTLEDIELEAPLIVIGLVDKTGSHLRIINPTQLPPNIATKFTDIALTESLPMTDVFRNQASLWLETEEEIKQSYPSLPTQILSFTKTKAIAALPLCVHDENLGAVTISYKQTRHFSEKNRKFLQAIVTQCAVAINRVQSVKKTQEIAVVEERHHLARELHDAVSQSLFTAKLISESLLKSQGEKHDNQKALLENVYESIRSAQSEMRVLLYELRPDQLAYGDIGKHFQHLAQRGNNISNISINVDIPEELTLTHHVRFALYRITQEALNNCHKHASCEHIMIKLEVIDNHLHLSIIDNGDGFDVNSQTSGFGLMSMIERAEKINAHLHIESKIGEGTQIRMIKKIIDL